MATMNLQNGDQAPSKWSINLDAESIITGDASLKVIFNNITGENFLKPEPWREGNHDQYLAFMRSELQVEFAPGQVLALVSPGGIQEKVHSF